MAIKDILLFRRKNNKKALTDKLQKWVTWATRILRRRGEASHPFCCAYHFSHIVSEPQEIGGGWQFKSRACSGCAPGTKYHTGTKVPKGTPHCAFLMSPLVTLQKVSEGDIINLKTQKVSPKKTSRSSGEYKIVHKE